MGADMARERGEAKPSTLATATRALGRAGRAALDFVFPPTCPVTDELVDAPGSLAPDAWAALTFVTEPLCPRCGAPFEFDPRPGGQGGPGVDCAACVAKPPKVARMRAALVYDEASRGLILQLKHAARTDGLAVFASWMAAAAGDLARPDARIAPIPLHASRLRARRFNQAALLARALAKRTGAAFDPDTLARRRATPTQAGKSAKGRARNVAGAFAVRPGRAAALEGARILLVDDVATTGSTFDAAARTLLAAGARQVDAVALARVVRPRDVAL